MDSTQRSTRVNAGESSNRASKLTSPRAQRRTLRLSQLRLGLRTPKLRDFGRRKEEKPWEQEVERERKKNQRKTKLFRDWTKTEPKQLLKDAEMEPMAENKPAGKIQYELNPLGRMKNRSGGSLQKAIPIFSP